MFTIFELFSTGSYQQCFREPRKLAETFREPFKAIYLPGHPFFLVIQLVPDGFLLSGQ